MNTRPHRLLLLGPLLRLHPRFLVVHRYAMLSCKTIEICRRLSSAGWPPGDSEEGLLVLRRPSWRDERRGKRERERESENPPVD